MHLCHTAQLTTSSPKTRLSFASRFVFLFYRIMVLGKVRALAIYFDSLNENNLPVFSGGDLVSGRVVVEVTGDVRVKSLDIHARGVAKVRWTESRNAGANTTYTQNYTEEVEYLHHYDTLIGEERGESGVVSQCLLGCVCVCAQRWCRSSFQNFCPSEFLCDNKLY